MYRGVWWAIAHGITKSWTQLNEHARILHYCIIGKNINKHFFSFCHYSLDNRSLKLYLTRRTIMMILVTEENRKIHFITQKLRLIIGSIYRQFSDVVCGENRLTYFLFISISYFILSIF